VLIIDDEPDMRLGLKMILGDNYLIGEASSGEEGIIEASNGEYPVVILDLAMKGLPGIETLELLRRMDESQKVIILTGHGSQETAISAVNMGAFKYVLKPVGSKLMRRLVEEAFAAYEKQIGRRRRQASTPEKLEGLGLSPREAQVAHWVIQGEGNREIALRLDISPRTVEKHLEAVQETLGVNRRGKIASRVRELGFF